MSFKLIETGNILLLRFCHNFQYHNAMSNENKQNIPEILANRTKPLIINSGTRASNIKRSGTHILKYISNDYVNPFTFSFPPIHY